MPNLPEAKTPVTVYLVDDDPRVRRAMIRLLESCGYRVKAYENSEVFLNQRDQDLNGCIVLDIKMPGLSGLDLLQRMRAMSIEIPAIMLTGYAEIPDCVRALRHGAVDFLEKPVASHKLLEAIRSAISINEKSRAQRIFRRELYGRLKRLSGDEVAVLDRIAAGTIQRQIANELDVSLRTVQFRRARILEKLEVETAAELLQLISTARTQGLYPLHSESRSPVAAHSSVEKLMDDAS